MNRPNSLHDVVVRLCDESLQGYERILANMPLVFNDFLHGWQPHRCFLERDPGLTGCPVADAWIAGWVEHECQKYGWEPPGWIEQPSRFLTHAVVGGGRLSKSLMVRDTPAAWRRRLVFLGPP